MTFIEVKCWQSGMYIVGMGLDNEFSLLMQLHNSRVHLVRAATCNIFQLYSICCDSV
jgi:hypothetical protein